MRSRSGQRRVYEFFTEDMREKKSLLRGIGVIILLGEQCIASSLNKR